MIGRKKTLPTQGTERFLTETVFEKKVMDTFLKDVDVFGHVPVFEPKTIGSGHERRITWLPQEILKITPHDFSDITIHLPGDLSTHENHVLKVTSASPPYTFGWAELAIGNIPNLSADKITSGTLGVNRIPSLDTDKITTGKLPISRGGTNANVENYINGKQLKYNSATGKIESSTYNVHTAYTHPTSGSCPQNPKSHDHEDVTTYVAGFMTSALFDKLEAIEALADVTDTVNVTAAMTDGAHGSRGGSGLHSLASTIINGFMSALQFDKLEAIEALADKTDATNVAAAGAVMDGDFSSNGVMRRTGAGAYTITTGATQDVTISGTTLHFSFGVFTGTSI